jgi:hypothetical protein
VQSSEDRVPPSLPSRRGDENKTKYKGLLGGPKLARRSVEAKKKKKSKTKNTKNIILEEPHRRGGRKYFHHSQWVELLIKILTSEFGGPITLSGTVALYNQVPDKKQKREFPFLVLYLHTRFDNPKWEAHIATLFKYFFAFASFHS